MTRSLRGKYSNSVLVKQPKRKASPARKSTPSVHTSAFQLDAAPEGLRRFTADEHRHAQLTVADHAVDVADCRDLLEMLGLVEVAS